MTRLLTWQRKPNTDGLINCLLQHRLFYPCIQKSMREEFNPLIKSFYTRTDPIAETKSMGCKPTRELSWFLQYYQDSCIVTGQLAAIYRDSPIWTTLPGRENFRPSTGTMQKLMPTLTRTATH